MLTHLSLPLLFLPSTLPFDVAENGLLSGLATEWNGKCCCWKLAHAIFLLSGFFFFIFHLEVMKKIMQISRPKERVK